MTRGKSSEYVRQDSADSNRLSGVSCPVPILVRTVILKAFWVSCRRGERLLEQERVFVNLQSWVSPTT